MSGHERFFYLVTHFRPDTEADAMVKVIGLFESKAAAQRVVSDYRKMEGFDRYPKGFAVQKLWLNQRRWEGGFFSGFDKPSTY